MKATNKLKKIQRLVSGLFKNNKGEPFKITLGQARLFASIIDPSIKWLWMSAPTRYGKSEILAIALIYLAVVKKIKIPIVAGSADKANKIMEYILQHISDHPSLYNGLLNLTLLDVEKLKVSMSKETLRWADGGWIYITSIDSRSKIKEGEGVVGEGGDVVVLEEAGLIKDRDQFSKVVRMPEANNGWGKLIQSGNCVENSVFQDAYESKLYKKIRISLQQAIDEGRYTLQELREKKMFTTSKDWKRYYLVKFPDLNEFTYFKPKKYEILPEQSKLKYFVGVDLALGDLAQDGVVDPNKKSKGSLVGIIVLARDRFTGQVYEVYNFGKAIGPDETIKTIFNMPFPEYIRIGIEDVLFQRYFLSVIKAKSKAEGRYLPFMGVEQKLKKEVRIESMEPIVNTGQILFSGTGELWDEMTEYPDTDKMDCLDALEIAWRMVNHASELTDDERTPDEEQELGNLQEKDF